MEDELADLVAGSQPDVLRATLAANADELRQAAAAHGGHGTGSLRTVTYKGHEIVIRTTYEITVDGRPFDAEVSVNNLGRVHYHGLPTRDFASAIDLVKKVVDVWQESFASGATDHGGHDHGGHGTTG